MGNNQVTIFAVIYVELMQQGAISSKELGLFSNFILEMDCCIYIDITVVRIYTLLTSSFYPGTVFFWFVYLCLRREYWELAFFFF